MRFYLLLILFLVFGNVKAQKDSINSDNKVETNFKIPGYLKLNFGFTFLDDADASMETDAFPSRSLDIYYSKPFFIGENFSFNPGLGISNDRLSFSNDVILSEIIDSDGSKQIIVDTLSFTPEKNSLKGTYLILPVALKYYFGSGKYDKRRFFVGVGGEVGLLLNSSTKVKQKVNNSMNHSKIKKDFGLNDLKYGISIQLGIGNFNVYYKKYFSDLFGENSLPMHITKNPNINKVGISFSVF
tara:strand:- start:793 stop:1518 length:726 start_codon:yes stop_codon:yes gene_type:complete